MFCLESKHKASGLPVELSHHRLERRRRPRLLDLSGSSRSRFASHFSRLQQYFVGVATMAMIRLDTTKVVLVDGCCERPADSGDTPLTCRSLEPSFSHRLGMHLKIHPSMTRTLLQGPVQNTWLNSSVPQFGLLALRGEDRCEWAAQGSGTNSELRGVRVAAGFQPHGLGL